MKANYWISDVCRLLHSPNLVAVALHSPKDRLMPAVRVVQRDCEIACVVWQHPPLAPNRDTIISHTSYWLCATKNQSTDNTKSNQVGDTLLSQMVHNNHGVC